VFAQYADDGVVVSSPVRVVAVVEMDCGYVVPGGALEAVGGGLVTDDADDAAVYPARFALVDDRLQVCAAAGI